MSIPPEQEEPKRPQGRDPAATETPAPGAGDARRWSRRRFGKAALVATPVIATLYGRPLRAATNCTPSGWISGNTSLHSDLQDCGGDTPGYWQGSASQGQHPGWKATTDDPLDSPTGFPGLSFFVDGQPATMLQAVEGPGETPFDGTGLLTRKIMRFGTAALLNARFLTGYSLTESQVTEIVAMTVLHGGYTTPSGDHLTAEQVKAFLENTMDMPTWGP